MKKLFRRIGAYLIDIFIISAIVTLLTSIDKINFQYKNYQKYYKEYSTVSEKYTKTVTKQIYLEKKYKTKKINKQKYQEKKTNYQLKIKNYKKDIERLQYKISRNSIIYYLLYIAFALGYFGIFQSSFNGQTLGKRLMKLKVVQINDKSAKTWQYLLRTFILLNLWMYILNIIFVNNFNASTFYTSSLIINEVSRGIQLLTLLMIIMSKSGRGLHDYVAKTKVIELDHVDKVIEAEIVEKKRKVSGDK